MGLLSSLFRAGKDAPNPSFDESDAVALVVAAVVVVGFVGHRILIVNPAQRRDDNKRFAKKSQNEITRLLAGARAEGVSIDWASIAQALNQRGVEVDATVLAASSANFGYSEELYINELRRRLATVDRDTREKLAETAVIIGDVLASARSPAIVDRLRAALGQG
jgi:hypothetical protein